MTVTDEVLELIRQLAELSSEGDFIFRGEPARFPSVSSSLYREHPNDFPAGSQEELLDEVEKYSGPMDREVLLTQLQHFGGSTNLIDFTTDFLIALFFACDGYPGEDGRVILLKRAAHPLMLPKEPVSRVISQKSVFVDPFVGHLKPDKSVVISKRLKRSVLRLLQQNHGITVSSIYNDIYGYIKRRSLIRSELLASSCFVDSLDQSIGLSRVQTSLGTEDKIKEVFDIGLMSGPDLEYCEDYKDRADQYMRQGNFTLAIEDYKKVLTLNREYALAAGDPGEAYKAIGDPRQVLTAAAFNGLGLIYRRQRDIVQAISFHARAVMLHPDSPTFQTDLGVSLCEESHFESALKYFERATELDEDHGIGYYNRAMALLCLRRWEPSIENLVAAKDRGIDIASMFWEAIGDSSRFREKYQVSLSNEVAGLLDIP